MRLTSEQIRLVEENIKIVPALVRTHTPPAPWTREDLMSAGYEALCKAAQRWSPDQECSFASYAYRRVNGAFLDELRILKLGSRTQKIEQPREMVEACEPIAPDDYSEIEVRQVLGGLSVRDRRIIELRMQGASGNQIAKEMGVHPSRVSQIVSRIHKTVQAA